MQHSGLQFLLPYMRPYRGLLVWGTLFALIGASASAFSPTLLGWGIDALTTGVTAQKLVLYSLGLIALSATLAIFRYQLRMLTGEIAAGVTYRMSQDLFHRLLLFDTETRQQYGTGDLLSRATSDFIFIWRFYSAGFQMSIHSLFLLLIGCGLMALTSPLLAVIVVVMLTASVTAQVRLGSVLEHSFTLVQQEMARLSAFAQEHLSAARMLAAYAQEQAVGAAFKQVNRGYVQKNLTFVLQSGIISPLPSLVVRLAATLVVLIGGLMIIRHQLTVGEYVQFIVYLNLLNSATRQITGAFERLQQGSAAAGRIGEVLHRWPKIVDAPEASEPVLAGNLRFDNVSVWSDDQKRWVLRNINLDLPAGSTLGIVGPTGSGKSMLISLLGRIYDPDEGQICLDGHDLRTLKLATLRQAVVYVPQESLLFSMPLRRNIALGRPETLDDEIHQAMERSRLSKDLPQLPKGLDSIVGERGATLSGGQKQRAALARALVRDPRVLILDDALASVDMRTAAEIISELRKASSHTNGAGEKQCNQPGQAQADPARTCIIVSQRMSAVEHADQIIVLEDGQIVERGNHAQLMALNGRYAAMVQREIQQAAEVINDGQH
ncbi:MAG: ABC transporter ATP-binding protein [Caldilineaceae bacterium]